MLGIFKERTNFNSNYYIKYIIKLTDAQISHPSHSFQSRQTSVNLSISPTVWSLTWAAQVRYFVVQTLQNIKHFDYNKLSIKYITI